MKIGGPRDLAGPTREAAPAASATPAKLWEPCPAERVRLAQKLGMGAADPSKVLALLGKKRFVELQAVNVPGKIAWVNYELAKAHGFPVPDTRTMTKELEEALLRALSFRLLAEGEDVAGRETISVFADKYKGTGMGKNEGSGRAAFLPTRNLHIKGVGRTPLANVEGSDFTHSHGGAPMREGFLEAIWGEVGDNLFTHGSTQVLAVIDTGDHTEWEDGSREKRALIIRAGRQLRPAHLMTSLFAAGSFSIDAFARAMKDSGDLVQRNNAPDLAATMKRVIERHALTAAESYRHRVLHGAISTSNLELDGSQLDLGTQTAQPRTAPIKVLGHGSQYGAEHVQRGKELQFVYDAMRNLLTPSGQKKHNAKPLDVRKLLDDAYEKALDAQLVAATGLPPEFAQSVGPSELPKVIRELAELSHVPVADADKSVSERDAVVDVFNLLRWFPRDCFSGTSREQLVERAFALLEPEIRTPEQATRVRALAARFVEAYVTLMEKAKAAAPSARAFERQVTNRAAFENAPLDHLYRARLNEMLIGAIDRYAATGEAAVLKDAVDTSITYSLRSVERLLTQGTSRGNDTQMRTIAGVDYCVRVEGDDRTLRVALPLASVPEHQRASLRYRFTTNDWKDGPQEAVGRVEGEQIVFSIPMLPSEIGRLEGVFHSTRGDYWLKDRSSNFRGYVFAIPE